MKRVMILSTLVLFGCAQQIQKQPSASVVGSLHARPSAGITLNPAPLHTTVSGRNVADISRDVQGWHDEQHADCKFVKVVAAEVITQEPTSIVEHWTIEACKNQQFTYRVFIIPGTGALTDMVSNVDGSPATPAKP